MFNLIKNSSATNYEKSLVVFSQLASLTDNMVREGDILNALFKLKKPISLDSSNDEDLVYNISKMVFNMCGQGDISWFNDQHPQRIRAKYFRLTEEGLRKADHAIYKGSLLEQEVRDSIATVADEVITGSRSRYYFGKGQFPKLSRYVSFMKPEEK
jgi:hypothetical protein